MVTFGAASLIVSAFRRVRRSRSTDAFQTCDPGRAGVHLLAEAVHGTGPSDVLTRIKRERVPTFFRTLLEPELAQLAVSTLVISPGSEQRFEAGLAEMGVSGERIGGSAVFHHAKAQTIDE
jgi:hypothetical protein